MSRRALVGFLALAGVGCSGATTAVRTATAVTAAFTSASDGDVVLVNSSILLTSTLSLYTSTPTNVTIQSAPGGRYVLDGQGSVQIFSVDGQAHLTISDIDLRNGHSSYGGGALWIGFGAQATIRNCILSDNYGYQGGAIHSSGLLDTHNVTFRNNSAWSGGGIFTSGNTSLKYSRFTENFAII